MGDRAMNTIVSDRGQSMGLSSISFVGAIQICGNAQSISKTKQEVFLNDLRQWRSFSTQIAAPHAFRRPRRAVRGQCKLYSSFGSEYPSRRRFCAPLACIPHASITRPSTPPRSLAPVCNHTRSRASRLAPRCRSVLVARRSSRALRTKTPGPPSCSRSSASRIPAHPSASCRR